MTSTAPVLSMAWEHDSRPRIGDVNPEICPAMVADGLEFSEERALFNRDATEAARVASANKSPVCKIAE